MLVCFVEVAVYVDFAIFKNNNNNIDSYFREPCQVEMVNSSVSYLSINQLVIKICCTVDQTL